MMLKTRLLHNLVFLFKFASKKSNFMNYYAKKSICYLGLSLLNRY